MCDSTLLPLYAVTLKLKLIKLGRVCARGTARHYHCRIQRGTFLAWLSHLFPFFFYHLTLLPSPLRYTIFLLCCTMSVAIYIYFVKAYS